MTPLEDSLLYQSEAFPVVSTYTIQMKPVLVYLSCRLYCSSPLVGL
jgi:hypothetical protein